MRNSFKICLKFARYDGMIVRLALLTERRGFAIEALSVAQTTDDYFSMHLVLAGDSHKFNHVCQQITKLVDVIELTRIEEVERVAVSG